MKTLTPTPMHDAREMREWASDLSSPKDGWGHLLLFDFLTELFAECIGAFVIACLHVIF
jgi:hypothetical protein